MIMQINKMADIRVFKGTNLNRLEEAIITQAEISELKAEFSGAAKGVVLEAQTHKQRG